MDRGARRELRDESGQVLVLAAVVMVVLIAITGFALDVGRAYLVQRQLQAATDAAALAGALELPDRVLATQVARDYGPEPSKRNTLRSNDNATVDVQTRCVTAIVTDCTAVNGGVNAISVDTTSNVKTVFAKIIGIDSLTVKARATACSPCSVKPLDIMLVLDRTGSMCQVTNPNYNPAGPDRRKVIGDPMVNAIDPATGAPYGNPRGCTDLTNAKDGIRTFLSLMDPRFDHVGLAVLPPAASASTSSARCASPSNANYDLGSPAYKLVGLSSDYASAPGTLLPGSTLVSTLSCLPSNGSTAYASSIAAAQKELADNGRRDVMKIIVFLSDGAANTSDQFSRSTGLSPCRAGIESARRAKSAGTVIYSIGYDLNGSGTDPEQCSDPAPNSISSYDALKTIATSTETFYNKPDPGQLNTIFAAIAADIFRTAQLIDDSLS